MSVRRKMYLNSSFIFAFLVYGKYALNAISDFMVHCPWKVWPLLTKTLIKESKLFILGKLILKMGKTNVLTYWAYKDSVGGIETRHCCIECSFCGGSEEKVSTFLNKTFMMDFLGFFFPLQFRSERKTCLHVTNCGFNRLLKRASCIFRRNML